MFNVKEVTHRDRKSTISLFVKNFKSQHLLFQLFFIIPPVLFMMNIRVDLFKGCVCLALYLLFHLHISVSCFFFYWVSFQRKFWPSCFLRLTLISFDTVYDLYSLIIIWHCTFLIKIGTIRKIAMLIPNQYFKRILIWEFLAFFISFFCSTVLTIC